MPFSLQFFQQCGLSSFCFRPVSGVDAETTSLTVIAVTFTLIQCGDSGEATGFGLRACLDGECQPAGDGMQTHLISHREGPSRLNALDM